MSDARARAVERAHRLADDADLALPLHGVRIPVARGAGRGARVNPIRVAYADPPYLGMASRYSQPGTPEYHPDAARWDDPDEHGRLLGRLDDEFPDGWAYSLQAPALREVLGRAPAGVRVCAWVKTWATWRPCAGPAYAWEPVLVRCGARKITERRQRDWVAAAVGHMHTEPFFGAKPVAFSRWLFDVFALGEHPDDQFIDMFPGSGAVTRAWDEYRARAVTSRSGVVQGALFQEAP